MANAKEHKEKNRNKEKKSKINNWYDGKQQHSKKGVINIHVSWEMNNYNSGILMTSDSHISNLIIIIHIEKTFFVYYWKITSSSLSLPEDPLSPFTYATDDWKRYRHD